MVSSLLIMLYKFFENFQKSTYFSIQLAINPLQTGAIVLCIFKHDADITMQVVQKDIPSRLLEDVKQIYFSCNDMNVHIAVTRPRPMTQYNVAENLKPTPNTSPCMQ